MDNAVGALAILTLGIGLIGGLYLFLRHNRDPKNLDATKAVIGDDSSAHTAVRGGSKPDHMS